MSWDAMSQIDFELCSILALEPPRPPRIVTVIKSNCSLSWKRTRLWRTGRFFQPRKLEVSKTSHLHRFRRNMIGTAKTTTWRTILSSTNINNFVRPWHLSIFEPDCLTSVSNWQDEYGLTALELAKAYKTKTPACREHPSAHETIVKLLSSTNQLPNNSDSVWAEWIWPDKTDRLENASLWHLALAKGRWL